VGPSVWVAMVVLCTTFSVGEIVAIPLSAWVALEKLSDQIAINEAAIKLIKTAVFTPEYHNR